MNISGHGNEEGALRATARGPVKSTLQVFGYLLSSFSIVRFFFFNCPLRGPRKAIQTHGYMMIA